jgi:hypothetical protein
MRVECLVLEITAALLSLQAFTPSATATFFEAQLALLRERVAPPERMRRSRVRGAAYDEEDANGIGRAGCPWSEGRGTTSLAPSSAVC